MKMKYRVDMTGVDEIIGAAFAFDHVGSNTKYMQMLVESAHNGVSRQFNREVTAYAMASGGMKHMFEWGTKGIQRGKSNMSFPAESEGARLWRNTFTRGNGVGTTKIGFDFKPSVASVPKPLASETGINQEILDKLKTHIFWNKAFVMEMGIPVQVRRKNAKKLFIPLKYQGRKGYKLVPGPTQPDISHESKGTFSIYWLNFWEGRGAVAIQEDVEKQFVQDIEREITRIRGGTAHNLTYPNSAKDTSKIERTQRTITRNLLKIAQERAENGS